MNAEQLTEYRQEQEELMAVALEGADLLTSLAESGDAVRLRQVIESASADQRMASKLPSRLQVKLVSCRHCKTASLQLWMLVGKSRRQLSTIDLSRDFLAAFDSAN